MKHGPRDGPLRKTIVTPRELRAVFARMLEKRRARLGPARCCAAPLPFHVVASHRGAANWQIRAPAKCARGCDFLLLGIQKELRATYDLVPPPSSGRMRSMVTAGSLFAAVALYLAWAAR